MLPCRHNLDNYLTLTNQGIGSTVCTVSNKVQKGREISFDNACTSGKLASTGHFDFQSPDEENFTGTSHIVITGTDRTTSLLIRRRIENSRQNTSYRLRRRRPIEPNGGKAEVKRYK